MPFYLQMSKNISYIYIYKLLSYIYIYIYIYIYRTSEKNYNNLFATLSFIYFTIFRQMSDVVTNIPT